MSYYFRARGNDVDRVPVNDHSPAEKSKALDVLRGCVVIVRHPYEADPFSGAGNCWCGRHAGSRLHHVVVEPAGVQRPDTSPESSEEQP